MCDEVDTLGFGITLDTVISETACGRALSLSAHHCNEEHRPHRHVNDYVCIVLSGGFEEQQRCSGSERRNGFYFVHRAGETHFDRFGRSGAVCLSVHFAPDSAPSGVADGHCSTAARLAANDLALELANDRRDRLALASLTTELLGELGPIRRPFNEQATWMRPVLDAICDDPGRRWSLGQLAAIVQRHPVYLTQAFRARTGLSLGSFQRRRRLLSLSLELRRADTPLAVLAADFGYSDQSHMCTEFRTAFGVSPGSYRRHPH